MSTNIQISLIILAIIFFLFIFSNLRQGILDLKYTLIWLIVSGSLIYISIFPTIVFKLTELLKLEKPVNTVFLVGIFFLLCISFMQNIIISKMSNRLKVLNQELAILKHQVNKIGK